MPILRPSRIPLLLMITCNPCWQPAAHAGAVPLPDLCPELAEIDRDFLDRARNVSSLIENERRMEQVLRTICERKRAQGAQVADINAAFREYIVKYRRLVELNDKEIVQLLRDARVATEPLRREKLTCQERQTITEQNMIKNMDAHQGIEDGYAVAECKANGSLGRVADNRKKNLLSEAHKPL